jgi:uncharacterized protein YdaU (DUF1376 family)
VNHYPHHLGDYATGTQGFTMLDHGAYRLLMDAYYSTEQALLAEDVYAIARAGTAAERKAVEKVLARKFDLRDGRYHHQRIEAELDAYRNRADTARENGKLGGRKPKAKPEPNPDVTQSVTGSVTQTEPSGKLASNHKPITKEKAEARASRLPSDWRASTEQIEWALSKRGDWTAEHVLLVAERFRNHWVAKAGQDARKLDWDATWRNWVLGEKTTPPAKPKGDNIGTFV